MWLVPRMRSIRSFRSFFFNGAEVLSVLENCNSLAGFTVKDSTSEVLLFHRDGSWSYQCDFEQVYEHGKWLRVIRSVWNSEGVCIFSFEDESVYSEDSIHSVV